MSVQCNAAIRKTPSCADDSRMSRACGSARLHSIRFGSRRDSFPPTPAGMLRTDDAWRLRMSLIASSAAAASASIDWLDPLIQPLDFGVNLPGNSPRRVNLGQPRRVCLRRMESALGRSLCAGGRSGADSNRFLGHPYDAPVPTCGADADRSGREDGSTMDARPARRSPPSGRARYFGASARSPL